MMMDLLQKYDKSDEPVTHFPSRIDVPDNPSDKEDIHADDVAEDELDSWNDSHVSGDDAVETNNRLVKSRGMFDLSKFMIGSGSDNDDNNDNDDEIEESKKAIEVLEQVKIDPVEVSREDIDSPVWSDNDLDSWQSNHQPQLIRL